MSELEQFIKDTLLQVNAVYGRLEKTLDLASDLNRLEGFRKRFAPGKMLRTRLAYTLCPDDDACRADAVAASAACEMIHTASLFHDDVIDGAGMRRNQPTLWQEVGTTGAILMGDLFYSSSVELILERGKVDLAKAFVARIRELCEAEIEHELLLKANKADLDTALHLARGKTGPLFAFVAEACGRDDEEKAHFAEAGYLLGTAYQLYDDLLDDIGSESSIGKTLGTDKDRGKFTLVQQGHDEAFVRDQVHSLCQQAIAELKGSPECQDKRDYSLWALPVWCFPD